MNTSRLRAAVRHVRRSHEMWQCVRVFHTWVPIAAAYLGLATIRFPLSVRTRSRLQFDLEEFYDLETLWQIFCRNVYDVRPDDRVIIDAGANIGLFACYATWQAPVACVHAIEPFPATFERLVKTITNNGYDTRIVCHNVALSSSAGIGRMQTTATSSQEFCLVDAEHAYLPEGVPVRTTTLEAILDGIDAPRIDLVKMDIEGLEYEVLLSTPVRALRRIRRLTVEIHRERTGSRDRHTLVAYLTRAGFRMSDDVLAVRDYGILHFRVA